MTELRTSQTLLDALRKASERTPTEEELREQRVSFIMGTIRDDAHITRDRVKEVLEIQEGKRRAS